MFVRYETGWLAARCLRSRQLAQRHSSQFDDMVAFQPPLLRVSRKHSPAHRAEVAHRLSVGGLGIVEVAGAEGRGPLGVELGDCAGATEGAFAVVAPLHPLHPDHLEDRVNCWFFAWRQTRCAGPLVGDAEIQWSQLILVALQVLLQVFDNMDRAERDLHADLRSSINQRAVAVVVEEDNFFRSAGRQTVDVTLDMLLGDGARSQVVEKDEAKEVPSLQHGKTLEKTPLK